MASPKPPKQLHKDWMNTPVNKLGIHFAIRWMEIGLDGINISYNLINESFRGREVILKKGKYKGYSAVIEGSTLNHNWRAGETGFEICFGLHIRRKDGEFFSHGYYDHADLRRYYRIEELEFAESNDEAVSAAS